MSSFYTTDNEAHAAIFGIEVDKFNEGLEEEVVNDMSLQFNNSRVVEEDQIDEEIISSHARKPVKRYNQFKTSKSKMPRKF